MKEFFAMGGYAFYVWTSFGLTFMVMAIIALGTRLQRRRVVAAVTRRAQTESKPDAREPFRE